MKRHLSIAAVGVLAMAASGCGAATSIFGDGGTDGSVGNPDMSAWFHLPSGVWTVPNDVRIGTDGCQVQPNGGTGITPIKGQIYALVNDGNGGIKLGNPTDFANPANPQQYDATEAGVPPQPPNGASCPGSGAPAQCATEPTAVAFADQVNFGWLVRDNDNSTKTPGNCFYHRHVVNKITLTSDTTFTADYTRTDTKHDTCMQMTDCTSTWSWDFKFVKAFGQ